MPYYIKHLFGLGGLLTIICALAYGLVFFRQFSGLTHEVLNRLSQTNYLFSHMICSMDDETYDELLATISSERLPEPLEAHFGENNHVGVFEVYSGYRSMCAEQVAAQAHHFGEENTLGAK